MAISATITISAEDSTDLGRVFAAIGAALENLPIERLSSDILETSSPAPDAAQWYRQNGLRFYQRLRPTAQKALETIVAQGPTVPIAKVIAATGMEGPHLAGSLASVGSAVRGLGAPTPPFTADHKRGSYTMDPAVLEAFRAVLPTNGTEDR